MFRWTGSWRFDGYMVAQFYGQTGTVTVDAENEDEARHMIRYRASESLGVPMLHHSITVTSIEKRKKSIWE